MLYFSYHEDDATEVSSDLEVPFGHFLAERNYNGASLASCQNRVSIQICEGVQVLGLPSLLTI